MPTPAVIGKPLDVTRLLKELVDIGIALTSERDLGMLLERIVDEARRFTNAEAGTLYLREGDHLVFAVVQHDPLRAGVGAPEMRRRLPGDPVPLTPPSVAAYVATTGRTVLLPGRAGDVDAACAASTDVEPATADDARSALVVPLQEPIGEMVGVLQLVNARDDDGRIVDFDPQLEPLVRSLASQAAVAIRNAMLEELSFKDPLTGAYNRRYFRQRIEEESRRHARFGEPVSLVLLDLDHFKPVNDRLGHEAGDDVLREVAQLLMSHSRSFSIVTRYGGDEFAILLVNTPRQGAIRYAERIKAVVEQHTFKHGTALTASLGVATLPDDVSSSDELMPAADRALYVAKRLGRNAVRRA